MQKQKTLRVRKTDYLIIRESKNCGGYSNKIPANGHPKPKDISASIEPKKSIGDHRFVRVQHK